MLGGYFVIMENEIEKIFKVLEYNYNQCLPVGTGLNAANAYL